MKVRLKIFIVVTMLIVNSMTCIYAANDYVSNDIAVDSISKEDTIAIEKILSKIDDPERVEEIAKVLGTVAYYEINRDEESAFSSPNSDSIDIERLAALSDDEMKNEIKFLVEDVVQSNISNGDITWTNDFIDTYVKEYMPDQVSLLMTLNESNENESRPTEVPAALSVSQGTAKITEAPAALTASQGKAKITFTGKGLFNQTLFKFTCTTVFTYNGTNVLTMNAGTVGTPIAAGVVYNGIDYSYVGYPFGSNDVGMVVKRGDFLHTFEGVGASYYPELTTVINGDGTYTTDGRLN